MTTKVWPDFDVGPMYETPAPGWHDPALPDFRKIWDIARQHGYAVGLHGSMKRDVDLIAVPWVDTASAPLDLINAICTGINARRLGILEGKPCGRIAVNLQVEGWYKLIDLSIVCRV